MGLTSGHPSILRSLFFRFAIGLLGLTSFAQQPKLLAPHKPIPPRVAQPDKKLTPPMQRSMVGGLWMTDARFKSSIYLRNGVETDPITVTPILHLSNGSKYILPDVTVEAAGVAIIDINNGLSKQGISTWATLSGYVELQYMWAWDPFCATVRNVDTAHSMIFTYGLRPTAPAPILLQTQHPNPPAPAQTIEGMWWKQESNVTGFVSVANLSAQPAQTTIQVTDDQGKPIAQHNLTVSPHGMKLVTLGELQTVSSSQGGIRVTSTQPLDQIIVNGGLEDQAVGYSAIVPFSNEFAVSSTPVPMSIAELGLMTGAADSMMFLPGGTTFTPYSVLRNVSDTPVSLTPTLWWMEAGASTSAQLPKISLAPGQSQSLDLVSLLSTFGPKNFNGSFNLVFDGGMKSGALLMSSGSVDQTNTYVFEAVPRGVNESGSKSLQYWSTGNGDDTMVTIWNPADEAQDFTYTLYFSGGHYALPLHLGPRVTRSFNLSEIIQSQMPDADGNIIPASVHEGGAKIAGSHAENEHILVAIDSGTYNVRKATCTNNCQECDGYNAASLVNNPFAVAVSGTHQQNFTLTWHSGTQYNFNGNGSWSSSNNSVATVATGLVHGVSVGSPNVTVVVDGEPVQAGYICTGNGGCPLANFSQSSSGYVGPYQIEPINTAFQGLASCATGQAGWARNVTNQVQYFGGAPFAQAGVSASDTITISSTNALGISGTKTGTATTTGDGSFPDTYSVCSTACPASAGETDAQQSWVVGSAGLPHVNLVIYKCNSIAVDGH
jgi:hypothetical protein